MATENPYKPIENKLQDIQQDQFSMDQANYNAPPPMYNNYPQANASTPAFAAGTMVQIMPVANQPNFPQPVGPKSMEMNCPSCHCRIKTAVRHRSTSKTHIACLLLSWTCCCCCLPYCMDSCRNANHFCPMCGAFIGTYAS